MAGPEPGLKPLGRQRNGIGRGDPDDLKAQGLGPVNEGAFQRLVL